MYRRSEIRIAIQHARRGAASALIVGLALLGLPPMAARAADAASFDTKALVHQTQRLTNDAGQFYMAWWVPQALSQAILRETPNVQQADSDQMLRALEPYVVFALSRGQVGEHRLEDVHDRADLLRHSRLTVDGQTMTAAPADQDDPGAKAALEMIKPTLDAMLGRFGRGIEFALYRSVPGMQPLDPTMTGSLEYTLYRKHFQWQLPLWAPLVPAPVPARAPPAAMPVSPVTIAPMGPAAAPIGAPAVAPIPVQRRKIDPTTGEEFPERYNYNPYTGQKLVSQ
jgi:hypothetical protein